MGVSRMIQRMLMVIAVVFCVVGCGYTGYQVKFNGDMSTGALDDVKNVLLSSGYQEAEFGKYVLANGVRSYDRYELKNDPKDTIYVDVVYMADNTSEISIYNIHAEKRPEIKTSILTVADRIRKLFKDSIDKQKVKQSEGKIGIPFI